MKSEYRAYSFQSEVKVGLKEGDMEKIERVGERGYDRKTDDGSKRDKGRGEEEEGCSKEGGGEVETG
jgi:hypothetical protein